MLRCPNGHENTEDSKFCGECGLPVEVTPQGARSYSPPSPPETIPSSLGRQTYSAQDNSSVVSANPGVSSWSLVVAILTMVSFIVFALAALFNVVFGAKLASHVNNNFYTGDQTLLKVFAYLASWTLFVGSIVLIFAFSFRIVAAFTSRQFVKGAIESGITLSVLFIAIGILLTALNTGSGRWAKYQILSLPIHGTFALIGGIVFGITMIVQLILVLVIPSQLNREANRIASMSLLICVGVLFCISCAVPLGGRKLEFITVDTCQLLALILAGVAVGLTAILSRLWIVAIGIAAIAPVIFLVIDIFGDGFYSLSTLFYVSAGAYLVVSVANVLASIAACSRPRVIL